jgi:hypothetical protein
MTNWRIISRFLAPIDLRNPISRPLCVKNQHNVHKPDAADKKGEGGVMATSTT